MSIAGLEIKKTEDGKRYFKNIKYPVISFNETDIYIETVTGDRLDLLAYQYYNDVNDRWIIACANTLRSDSIYLPPGMQLRIPKNISDIKKQFNVLNKLI